MEEIQRRDGLLRRGLTVLHLGSSPGGAAQYAAEQVGRRGRVVACDLLEMQPISGVEFVRGDIWDDKVLRKLLDLLGPGGARLVFSDVSPNLSGVPEVDVPRSMCLAGRVLLLCQHLLGRGGGLLLKIFGGEGLDRFLLEIRSLFTAVRVRRLRCSRPSSRELYVVATGYRGGVTVGCVAG